MMIMLRRAAPAALAVALSPAFAGAQDVAGFYQGKTIEVYIGSDVGGGYNAYARTVGKHLVKYVPGTPDVIFKNMPGAGGRKLTAWLANVAPKTGAVIAASQPGSLVEPVLGNPQNAKYDPRSFGYIGSAESSVYLCLARTDAPVKTFADALKTELVLGASQRGASTLDTALMLKNVLGAKFKVVKGYKGSRAVILALERNEVQGVCGYAWSSMMSQAGHLVRDKKVNVFIQYALDDHPEAVKAGVPNIWQFTKTPEQKALMELLVAQQAFGRPMFVPAQVPAERLAALRAAFDKAMKDPAYVADAKKQKLDVSPASGKRVEALIGKIFSASKEMQEKAKKALYTE
jgi:tripartite-type tricarboxylate transporter receptor subunit TctC